MQDLDGRNHVDAIRIAATPAGARWLPRRTRLRLREERHEHPPCRARHQVRGVGGKTGRSPGHPGAHPEQDAVEELAVVSFGLRRAWVGLGIFTYDLQRMAGIAAAPCTDFFRGR
jgi:hypothetical protein